MSPSSAATTTATGRPIDAFLRPDGRPRVIAHRGFSAVAPENTRAAFERALELRGVDMIELDVTSSRDHELVVFHDERLDRTTDGTGVLLRKTLRELRQLDAGSWFAADFAGEKIPTLPEALELLVPNTLVNVEIKAEAVTDTLEGGIAERVVECVRGAGARDHVVVSSFEPRALEQVHQADPEIRTASLYQRRAHRGLTPTQVMDHVGSRAFHVASRWLRAAAVAECHAARRLIGVYTVNETDEMSRLLDLGVDALFTDRPDRMLDLLQLRGTPPPRS